MFFSLPSSILFGNTMYLLTFKNLLPCMKCALITQVYTSFWTKQPISVLRPILHAEHDSAIRLSPSRQIFEILNMTSFDEILVYLAVNL